MPCTQDEASSVPLYSIDQTQVKLGNLLPTGRNIVEETPETIVLPLLKL